MTAKSKLQHGHLVALTSDRSLPSSTTQALVPKHQATCHHSYTAQTVSRITYASTRGRQDSTPKKPPTAQENVTAACPGPTLASGILGRHRTAHHKRQEPELPKSCISGIQSSTLCIDISMNPAQTTSCAISFWPVWTTHLAGHVESSCVARYRPRRESRCAGIPQTIQQY